MKDYETRVLATPFAKPDAYGALNMPVYYSAAFEFPNAKGMADAFAGRSMNHAYSRISNPTVQYLENRVQAATGAFSVTALNTGMAAISHTLTAMAGAGLNIVASKHLFGNTVSFMRDTLGSYGVETRFVDFCQPEQVEAAIDGNTCALFFEVITNPQLFVADIGALSVIARAKGVPLVADTTVVPFSVFHAKDWGIDIEVLSSTKYISGGATGLGGLIIDYGTFDWRKSPSTALAARVRKVGPKAPFTARLKTELMTNLGAMMTPQVAYMETLGLETLNLRFQRQAETTLWLALQCREVKGIRQVNYTGLEDNPFHGLSQRLFGPLPGAVFTIELDNREACYAFIDRLQLIHRATNLFDHRSLAIHPASIIFATFTDEQCREMSVSQGTIRLSIGLENGEDLLEDIKQAVGNS